MTLQCSHENCFPDTTCPLGYIDRTECENWNGVNPTDKEQKGDAIANGFSDIPWNGYALGTSDLAIIGGRGPAAVIGLVGPPDSGKTSLLAFLYMWLLKHGRIGDWMFAGSWTLGSWESVVQYSRWTEEPPPAFPPHTSSAGRHPGILHLSLRCTKTAQLRDVMFTDAPGEWFTQWARVPGDAVSVGARWVVDHSDAVLLLVDSAALADQQKLPATRRATRDLMERISADASSPVAVLWTKDDIDVPESVCNALSAAATTFLPQADVLRTTTDNPKSIEACFTWALKAATSLRTKPCLVEPRLSDDPFLAFRGFNVDV